MPMNNAFGYTIDRAGTVSVLKNPAHHGRVVGSRGRRTVWIGSVRRMGSGWAASNIMDATVHGFRTQKAAADALYNAYLQSQDATVSLPTPVANMNLAKL